MEERKRRNNYKEPPDRFCEYCGKKLERKYYPNSNRYEDFNVFMRRKYCDRICMRKSFLNFNGEEQTWQQAHDSARNIAKLFIEDRETCEICGKKGKMDIHHKDCNPHNNDLSNLQILCRSCHMKIHRHQEKVCSVEGCNNYPDGGLGYCNKHYARFKKYGSPYVVRWNTKHTKNDEDVISHLEETKELLNKNK